jgi:hypothetical protein
MNVAFTPDWTAYVEQNIVLNQGGTQQGQYYCCGAEAPDCEVQVEFQAVRTRVRSCPGRCIGRG